MEMIRRNISCSQSLSTVTACLQGSYYVLTGLWPLFSMGSFQTVTGRKVDEWLVNAVGVQTAAIGSVLGISGIRRRVSDEVLLLGMGSATAFAGIDIYYGLRGRISKIYLLDAFGQILLIVTWIATFRLARQAGRRS